MLMRRILDERASGIVDLAGAPLFSFCDRLSSRIRWCNSESRTSRVRSAQSVFYSLYRKRSEAKWEDESNVEAAGNVEAARRAASEWSRRMAARRSAWSR